MAVEGGEIRGSSLVRQGRQSRDCKIAKLEYRLRVCINTPVTQTGTVTIYLPI